MNTAMIMFSLGVISMLGCFFTPENKDYILWVVTSAFWIASMVLGFVQIDKETYAKYN